MLLIIIFIFIDSSALLYKFAQINILLFKFLIDGSSLIFSDNKSSTDKVGLLRFNLLMISKLKRSSLVLFSIQELYHTFSKFSLFESILSIGIIEIGFDSITEYKI